ncbi:E3 ubiquitin-protein ligase MGRN1 isoform X4 [Bos indicus]|uniref:E3 ubiquitin-protein ligase n=4 Tax=Bovinae TaxID=27592 RepID=E1BE47_BOVIN|nr:E3 ubiquitin-protein ligase MGRN1 isoform X3 [Bos taurus]XP_010838712.1 PREDICTED: E3 ubiquitin-protein ligase MGRN1 isoform X1 [Bison bison bison]XP_027383785.1 E3 ubiquitin-protein ligase MGRN1 isoform X4 [Bos indicus x Bos taurus]XP_027383786.1 E3 ubiquitin-protein ligase MGRN1 isoform X4 [Bos indicus x Bos taurus]
MGSILSRRIAGVEDIDIQANSAYRYPPKSGNYFASHFFMGGEKFDTPHPEGYLFGENMDLNFLGNRPVQFPYVTPAPHEPVKTLRSLVNIRKDSLRLVRYKDGADSPTEDGEKPRVLYSLEFTFDADARVAITVYCQAVEEFLNGTAAYSPKSPALQSETVHYKRGVSQQFSLPSFKIDFSEWKDDELNFDLDRGVFPVVIQAVVDEGDVVEVTGHAHVLLAAFEKHVDGSFSVKPLKQKQIVDRVSYLLQEIYGIENKNNQETKPSDEENSDNSNECVVCLSDLRDTLILPCRHLCLCNSCADTLRYQASNCPICRLPFRALLQIRAVRKKPGALSPISFSPVLAQSMDHDEHSERFPRSTRAHCPFKKSKSHPASLASKKPKGETSADSIPPGYEPISLLEALNGLRAVPPAVPPAVPTAPLYEEITYSGVSDGLSQASCPLAGIDRMVESSLQKGKPRNKSPDSTLRSPSSPIHEEDDSEALPAPGGAGLALSSSPESFMTETVDETSSLKQGSRVPSIENVLQDGSPEPCGRSQPGAPADVYLPALGPGSCSAGLEE